MPLLGKKDKKDITDYDKYKIADRAKKMGTFLQRGQTCGIYALAAALKTYNIRIPTETADHKNYPSLKGKSMRSDAKNLNITRIGELFDVRDVVTLAQQYGHTAEVKKVKIFNFFQTICLTINKNQLVMIPFSPISTTGLPDPFGGTGNAHWCLAIGHKGYLDTQGYSQKILVTHWDMFFAFDAEAFQKSNANLKTFKEAYYYNEKTGGINTWSDFNDVLTIINNKIDNDNRTKGTKEPHVKIEDLKKYLAKHYPSFPVKKVVKIPEAKLERTLAKQIVII